MTEQKINFSHIFKKNNTINIAGALDGTGDDDDEELLPYSDVQKSKENKKKQKYQEGGEGGGNEENEDKDNEENYDDEKMKSKNNLILSPYDEMNNYCDWHREHPHASTPRKLKLRQDRIHLHVCEEHPDFAYTQIVQKGHYKLHEKSKEFLPSKTGENATFKEVTEIAHNLEHQYRLEKRDDYYDPWWMHTVKVQADIFHAKEPNKNNIYKEEYDENDILNETIQKIRNHQKEREQKLREKEDELAISAYWGKPNRHVKTARHKKIAQSRYTIDGKEELGDYYQDRFEQLVEIALNEFYLADTNPIINDSLSLTSSTPNKSNPIKSNRYSNKKTFISTQLKSIEKKQENDNSDNNDNDNNDNEENDETKAENDSNTLQKLMLSSKSQMTSNSSSINKPSPLPPPNNALIQQQLYEDYKTSLEGEKEIQKITEKLVKYSQKVNKENQKSEFLSIANRGMDFLDACLHLNSIQVICLLKFGADANTLTDDEEPVFFLIFQKVLFIFFYHFYYYLLIFVNFC